MKNYKEKRAVFDSLSILDKIMVCTLEYEDKDDSIITYSKYIKDKAFIDLDNYMNQDYPYIFIIVNPKYRRKGLARELLKETLEYCALNHISKIGYIVDKENIPSRNLIRSFNYDYIIDRDYYEEYCFEFK